ncbi:formylmethanofuran dehydrogenase subunit E family protein [bacterium]|nr:formylmethanofuran dehydrogenase subunit E family protein [bacterium]
MTIPEELKHAAEFHTHLGPFLVIGLRMGAVVTREFGSEPFVTNITAFTGTRPPYSCLADGIQVSTPCTVGNGGLKLSEERAMAIEARHDDRFLSITLSREIFDWIESDCTEENQESFSLKIWEMLEERLLSISESPWEERIPVDEGAISRENGEVTL